MAGGGGGGGGMGGGGRRKALTTYPNAWMRFDLNILILGVIYFKGDSLVRFRRQSQKHLNMIV